MTRRRSPASGSGLRWRILTVAMLPALLAPAAQADETFAPGSFTLGTITVVGEAVQAGEVGSGLGGTRTGSVIEREEIRRFNRDTLGDALELLPGVIVSTNSRNEKTIAVRGFDARQVPLFIDGIPVYVPYDGYVDLDRFTTADLSAIQLAKGFSSVAYGANTLGGAINLISRKPTRAFEGDVSVGFASGQERKLAANVGTNQGLWYLQAGASRLQSDGFPLSSDFTPTPTEDGGRRDNAARTDSKASLKIGLTPNAGDEYAISYYRQDGEKGQPPSTDPAAARYWKWPYWDKESLYFVSRTQFGDTETLRFRLYQDRFDNEVDSYTDDTYSVLRTRGRGSVGTGRSIYEDRSSGGSVELESTRFASHVLRFVGHYKTDEHTELDATGLRNTNFEDSLASFAMEDNIRLAAAWQLSLGVARHALRPDRVFSIGNPYSLPDKQTATDVQAGLFHDWSPAARLYATVARKSRLPTLKDRYSQRLGTYVENPALRPEESINYELGYEGLPWAGTRAEAAVFFSDITDKIQSVGNVAGTLSQMQNVGEVRAAGVELGLDAVLSHWLEVGGSYTFVDLDNRSDPATRLTDVPRHKLVAHAVLRPAEAWELVALAQHDSSRWASNTVRLSGFTTLSLKAAYALRKDVSVEAGVSNLADKNYALADGFPSPGRMWFANAEYRF